MSTATIAVIPDLCLGINGNEALTGVAVYPNPNSGAFYVAGRSEQKLVLTNELGQEIKKMTLLPSNNFTVLLEELPDGVYFLAGETNKSSFNKKIIVIR